MSGADLEPARTRSRAAYALGWLILALGCASPPVNYYGEGAPALPALTERHRAALLDDLALHLVESRIQIVELMETGHTRRVSPVDGRAAAFEEFPLIALQAASLGAAPEARGAEFDVLVRTGEGPGVIVTVRHNVDLSLAVLIGEAPVELGGGSPTAAELQRDFAIGPLVHGDVAWNAADRRAIGAALALLSPAELTYLRDLPFVRQAGADASGHAGYFYHGEGAEGGRIILLDVAFRADGNAFVGSPEVAYPRSIYVILHEIGHAIAELDRMMLIAIFERDRARYNEAVVVANQYVDALNERYAVVNRLAKSSDKRTVQADIRTLEKEHRRIQSIMRQARERLEELAEKIGEPAPMAQAYGALPGARLGPTLYGSTSVGEGFAEAFALYHLDQASVERISPEVSAWFAGEQHLASALYPPLEKIEPPPTRAVEP